MTPFTLGDRVLHQFARDWELLANELKQLHVQMSHAVTGPKDHGTILKIEMRVRKLAEQFDRQRTLFEVGFQGDLATNADVLRLRKTLNDIVLLITQILGAGQPDRGKGLLSKSVTDFQERMKQLHPTYKATVGVKQQIITLPDAPQGLTGNPMLAIAVLLDLLRMVIARRKKPD